MRVVPLLLCSILLAACSSDDGMVNPSPQSLALTLSSTEPMTSTGDTRTVTAVIQGDGGATAPLPTLSWATSAPNVATVTSEGSAATITAVDDGTATITASAGSLTKSVTVTVHRRLASVAVTSPAPELLLGQSMQMFAIALDARGHELTTITSFTWKSSAPVIALFNTTGLVTAIFAFGAQTSTVSAEAELDGVKVSGSTDVKVVAPQGFTHGALLLSDFVQPTPTPTQADGIVYFFANPVRIDYRMTWERLSSPATEIHIHAPGGDDEIADVLVDLTPTLQTQLFGVRIGSITASDIKPRPGQPPISIDSLRTLMNTGKAYLDLHTSTFIGGEIRGQIQGPF